MPHATVTVVNLETNEKREFTATAEGDFEFPYLKPAAYRLEAASPGFLAYVRDRIPVAAGEKVRITVRLAVSSMTQTLTVTEEGAPQIVLDSGAINSTRTEEHYRFLPIAQGAEPFNLLATNPNFQSANTKYKFTVAGARTGQSEFQMDGVAATNNNNPELSQSMTMEGIREVRLQAVNNSAEYGLPGIYQMITKSGGNSIHGSAFYYHQNSALNARDYFATTKPKSLSHSYGGSFTGPIVLPRVYDGHNRSFFLLAYDGNFSPGSSIRIDTVPTDLMRGGNFSGLRQITDPRTNEIFPGNLIPSNRISPVALAFQQRFFPTPNQNLVASPSNNLATVYNNPGKGNTGDVRLDHKLSDKNQFYVRYGQRQFPATRLRTIPTIGSPSILRNFRFFVLSDTHIIRPNLINEFRFGRAWTSNKYTDGGQRALDVIAATGLQGITDVPDDAGMPGILITGFSSLQHNGNNRYDYHDRSRQFTNSLTWITGRHTVKFGGDWRYLDPDVINIPLGLYGQFNFTGVYSGHAYADFLLGIPQTSTKVPLPPVVHRHQNDIFGFVQDDFRLSNRLTLNVGLRYEIQTAQWEDGDLMYNYDPANARVVVPTNRINRIDPRFNPAVPIVTAAAAGYPEKIYRFTDKNNFAPRFGFAWRPTDKGTTVVRGGYGIYIVNWGNSLLSPQEGGPFSGISATFNNAITNGSPLFQFPNPFPSLALGPLTAPPSLNGSNPNAGNPYTQQWNLTLEREMAGMGLRLSYLGNKGTQLLYRRNINVPAPSAIPFSQNRRPLPLYGNISYQENGGNSNYHALQFEAARRFKQGLTYSFAWTWANNISDIADNGDGVYGSSIENPFDRTREHGRESYAIQHRAVMNVVWDLPFGKGKALFNGLSGIGQQILGGWQFTGLGTFQTGNWLTPVYSGSDASGTGTSGGRPDRIADGNLPTDRRSTSQWFDKSAFVVPPTGRFGNSGRNVIEGPGVMAVHIGLGKDFHFTDKVRFNLQAAAQNALNHPNLDMPNATINAGTAATISGTADRLEQTGARQVILRGRIIF